MLIHTHIRTHTHRRKEIIDDIGRTVCVRRRNKICPFLFPIFFFGVVLGAAACCPCACVFVCMRVFVFAIVLFTHARTHTASGSSANETSVFFKSHHRFLETQPHRFEKKEDKKKRNQNRMNPTRKEVPWEKVRDQRRRWRPRERRVTNAS